MGLKSTHKIFRASLARILCLLHIGLSIYVLFSVKRNFLYLIPLIGVVCLIAETSVVITIFKGREPLRWFSSLFFIYVTTIVGCYWFLELENIRKAIEGVVSPSGYKLTWSQLRGDVVSDIKIIWSEFELQVFFAIIMLTRWLIPKSNLSPQGLSDLLFKYFAISCDMLDFLTILYDITLIKNSNYHMVYWTLGVWTWSTIQFYIYVPKYEDEEKREFFAYITNSLLSVLFLDLPYFGVRMAAIFGFGSHNYNSYFFATKNFVLIMLQLVRIKATFMERKIRQNRDARRLKDQIGFDKEAVKMFDPHEIAKRNFVAERLKKQQEHEKMRNQYVGPKRTPDSYRREFTETSDAGDRYESLDSMDETERNNLKYNDKRLPNIEAIHSMKKAINKSLENLNLDSDLDSRNYNIDRKRPIYNDVIEFQASPKARLPISKPIVKNLVMEAQPVQQFGPVYKGDERSEDDSFESRENQEPLPKPFFKPKTASIRDRQDQLYSSNLKPNNTNNNLKFSNV